MEESKKVIKHYGTPRHSGRYPWGSGGHSQQSSKSFLGMVSDLLSKGMSEKEVAKVFGMKTTELRQAKSIAKAELRASEAAQALRLKDKGMSTSAIARRMGKNESSVRALLDPVLKERANVTKSTAGMLKQTVSEKGVIDIGAGVEAGIGISRTKLNTAVKMLKDEGYNVYYVKVKQLGTGKYTSIKVLAPPDATYSDVYKNRENIAMISSHTENGGRSYLGLEPIQSVSSNRVQIRYGEEGKLKDGVIELRRGVEELDMGGSKYAQVRIGVDGTHYLKGMAVYSDKMPAGVDIIYNSNKPPGTPKEKVFKEMAVDLTTGKIDADNPFGATIKRQNGALNIVNEEGDWSGWSKTLSSQVLSKQRPSLAKRQLKLSQDLKQEEFDEIMGLTNPVIKKRLLESFADDCDASASHLKAVALPRQASHVLLPVPEMKQTEVYAPMFTNGENVVLIRHPHGGIFEIPELVVNNRVGAAKKIMEGAPDAIGIHPKVAEKLSGADFDGDSVLVIPNKSGVIKTAPSLKGLKDFDPKESYPYVEGMKTMTTVGKGLEMGNISNLITDMTIQGADHDEIARAVRHSMVVIDAEKHGLNYKQSAIDNGIAQLKEKYQGGPRAGAATLISKAKSEQRVPHRKDNYKIDPKTGEKVYNYTDEEYINRAGQTVKRTTKSTKMAEAKSAFDLSSGTKMEAVYAEYADSLKAMAKKARKELANTPNMERSPTAAKTFSKEVESLKAKLRDVYRKKPLERKAQLAGNAVYRAKLKANPNLDASQRKRLRGQALNEARARLGSKKPHIEISDNEWKAIQLGAISHSTMTKIINSTDIDKLKTRATPRTAYKMTPSKVSRAKAMAAAGYTPAEIASAIGVSATTVVNTLG